MIFTTLLAAVDLASHGEGSNQIVTIANQFGVMPHMLVAQIINFCLVAWIFWEFVLKPIQAKLDERSKVIDEGVKRSQESETILREARKHSEQILQDAYKNSQGILDDTRKKADEFAAEARAATKKETQEMLEKAQKTLALEQEQFLADSKERLASMVVEVARKSLGEDLTDDQKNRYSQRASEEFTTLTK